jgi:hypothetical protein
MIPDNISFIHDFKRAGPSYYNLKNVDIDSGPHLNYSSYPHGRFRTPNHCFSGRLASTRNSTYQTFKQAKKSKRFMIYEIGLVESPDVWLEDISKQSNKKNKLNIFDLIYQNNPKLYLQVRKGRAIIHLDQSMEAFPLYCQNTSHSDLGTRNFYKIIHDKLSHYKISPSSIHYSTSNLYEIAIYNRWCSDNNIKDKLVIHQYNFFAQAARHAGFFQQPDDKSASITFEEHLSFKNKNDIKTFSNLNRVVRDHRCGLLYMLNYYDLINNSETSFSQDDHPHQLPYPDHPAWQKHNVFAANQLLPLTLDVTNFNINQAQNFFKETYLNTWYSVITETYFQDYFKYSMFFSEKIFKPMRARHPIVLVGQPYALAELTKLGFKTFNEFWDESYDVCRNPTERLEKICKLIAQLNKLSKTEWIDLYKRMEPVLEHNYNHVIFTDWDGEINV